MFSIPGVSMVLFRCTRNALSDFGLQQFAVHTSVVSGRTGYAARRVHACVGRMVLIERIGIRETRSLFSLEPHSSMDPALNPGRCQFQIRPIADLSITQLKSRGLFRKRFRRIN
ncbi:hypothetical protein [Burkholderia ambifaria]|uniref:hypothetical protein n=1 Tax=Burkholderia ambifaria TaxID=152480 RepID=UPI0012FE54C5|nr:hypothetical protein [Burkholderia ambifaria]